jgi:hypothetical protein
VKIRSGFVSNSSSSSFILDKHFLSPAQIAAICNHMSYAEENKLKSWKEYEPYKCGYIDDTWHVEERDNVLKLSIWMDNFDMTQFLIDIDVAEEAIVSYTKNG